MRIETKPRVYLVARTEFNDRGVEQYLKENNIKWPTPTEGVIGAEKLVELAGRECYQSWGSKAGSKTNFDYIQNLLGRNKDGSFKPGPAHGCYDSETDVLTQEGWKNWTQVTGKEKFATLDRNHQITYQNATGVMLGADYSGWMYEVKSKNVDLLVTPNHNMYVNKMSTKLGRRKKNYGFYPAFRLLGQNVSFKKDGIWLNNQSKYDQFELALIGFTIGDGTVYDHGKATFHLRRDRKIEYLEKICNILNIEIKRNEHEGYSIDWPFPELELYNGKKEKKIPPQLFTSCDQESLFGLFEGLINSDGNATGTGIQFDTTSEELAGGMQQLCLHIGMAANISQAACYKNREKSFGKKPMIRLHMITHSRLNSEINCFSRNQGRDSSIEDWSGKVYCVEVPNHTLYVRRNGKPVWCGNSVIEHPDFSFLITGAARAFSHELVRHRAGWAYSQLSTRYCDYELEETVEGDWSPGWVIPPLAQLSVRTQKFFEECYGQEKEMYVKALHFIEEDLINNQQFMEELNKLPERERKRALRKASRGAARDLLPNGVEAIIVATANARAIWNTIYLRASEHAEAVIRDVFVQICRIMEKEMPSVFHGIKYGKCWDTSDMVILPREHI